MLDTEQGSVAAAGRPKLKHMEQRHENEHEQIAAEESRPAGKTECTRSRQVPVQEKGGDKTECRNAHKKRIRKPCAPKSMDDGSRRVIPCPEIERKRNVE